MDDAKIIPCGVALIRRGREFLISQRNENDTFGSLWEFPGGKKDKGESFEQCVAREVLEEIGVRVRVDSKFMEIRKESFDRQIWLNFFLCTYLSGEPHPVDCQQVLWVDVGNLNKYSFPPANEAVIDQLITLCAVR